MKYDVAIIGAGVTGCLIARELSRYKLTVCLLDREEDVSMGTSRANSAIIHAGYDAPHGTLKALLNVRGNRMMDQVARELGVPFRRVGSMVLAFGEGDLPTLRRLYENGVQNGVRGLALLRAEEAKALEPEISDKVTGALLAPTAGIICPYELTIAAAENAAANGVQLRLGCEVTGIVRDLKDGFDIETQGEHIQARYLVNAAGLYADRIAAMAGDESFRIKPRRGEYMILDKSEGSRANHVLFQPPTQFGKGILVAPTVDGNLLIGPNAHDVDDKADLSTTAEGLREVSEGALKSVPGLDLRRVITAFSGLRALSPTGDFLIQASSCEHASSCALGLIHAACIESPGLSASPAIAEYVVKLLEQQGLALNEKTDFNPIREPIAHFAQMGAAEQAALIRKNPLYGHVVCRCETVTEGEIVEAIRRGARSLDAIKRRTRQGMGRCQGGFCTPRVLGILARELGIPEEEVTKCGGDSRMLVGRLK